MACLTNQLAVAALWPPVEALPVHDAAHNAFMTLPPYTHGMRNEFALRSRTGVRASFMALTCAEGTESLSSRQTEGKLIGWGPRSAVCLPDAFSHRCGSACGAMAHDAVHGAVHDAFMTLPPYTRIREGEVHELGLGVRKDSHRARSRPVSATSESIERECPATSAEGTARCASRGNIKVHDAVHDAFMTLPTYTRISEFEAPQLGSSPKLLWLSL